MPVTVGVGGRNPAHVATATIELADRLRPRVAAFMRYLTRPRVTIIGAKTPPVWSPLGCYAGVRGAVGRAGA
jgi:hypothetical protein